MPSKAAPRNPDRTAMAENQNRSTTKGKKVHEGFRSKVSFVYLRVLRV
jgi:hypothetical protein